MSWTFTDATGREIIRDGEATTMMTPALTSAARAACDDGEADRMHDGYVLAVTEGLTADESMTAMVALGLALDARDAREQLAELGMVAS